MNNNLSQYSYFKQLEGIIDDLPKISKLQTKVKIPTIKKSFTLSLVQVALLSCLCYIDGFGKEIYGGKASKVNFIRVLIEHGGNDIFGGIHLKMMLDYKQKTKDPELKEIIVKIEPYLVQYQNKFYKETEILKMLENQNLSKNEIDRLAKKMNYFTYAAIVYEYMRCPFVHNLSSSTYSFDSISYEGEPVPKLDFQTIYKSLKNIISSYKQKMNFI